MLVPAEIPLKQSKPTGRASDAAASALSLDTSAALARRKRRGTQTQLSCAARKKQLHDLNEHRRMHALLTSPRTSMHGCAALALVPYEYKQASDKLDPKTQTKRNEMK